MTDRTAGPHAADGDGPDAFLIVAEHVPPKRPGPAGPAQLGLGVPELDGYGTGALDL